MIVVKKFLPRRTVLRGFGATLALPLLDGMVPALTALQKTAAQPVRRLGALYAPMGMSMGYWTPATDGALQLSSTLAPMELVRDRCLVVTGLGSNEADIKDGGPHPRIQGSWLTGTLPRRTEGADIRAGISMDQIAAREFSKATQLGSLQIGIESNDVLGACAQGYSCAYSNTISWLNPTTPLPMENNPRAVFERLFGSSDSTDARTRLADIAKDRSILDSVTDELKAFQRGIGARDRTKMAQYLEAVRDVERRIHRAEEQAGQQLPVVDQPAGAPASYEEHVKLMFDLLTLAFQCDLTRVFTFLTAREASNRAYPEIGIADAHHPLSHHQDNPEKLARLAKVNAFYMKLFVYFVEKLKATPDGEGSLLDHTVMLYGSGMGDSNLHSPQDLPALVVSGSGIQINAGRHLRYPRGTPLSNLQLTLLDRIGVPVEHFGDSTGELSLLAGV